MILECLDQPGVLSDILGSQVKSSYFDDDLDELSEQDLADAVSWHGDWELDPSCRIVYDVTTLYINGERIGDQAPSEFLELANSRSITQVSLSALDTKWDEIAVNLISRQLLIPSENPDRRGIMGSSRRGPGTDTYGGFH